MDVESLRPSLPAPLNCVGPELLENEDDAMMPIWVARVAAGDQAAARELVDRLQPRVLRIVRVRKPRGMAEEDLTQEVFMKMFARLGQYQGDAPFALGRPRRMGIGVSRTRDGRSRRPEAGRSAGHA